MSQIHWIILVSALIHATISQQPGEYDFNERNQGQKHRELHPGAIAGIVVGVVAGIAGLATTIFFCYFVYKKQDASVDHTNSFEIRRY